VDDRLRTSAEATFAVGDVDGGPQFTHVSLDDQRTVRSALAGGDRTRTDRPIERIMGAAILAPHGGDVMAVVDMTMLGGLTASELKDAVLPHPTTAEGLNQLFASWVD